MAPSNLRSALLGGQSASTLLTFLTFLGAVSAVPCTSTLGDITILATDTLRRASRPVLPPSSTDDEQPPMKTAPAQLFCLERHVPSRMQRPRVLPSASTYGPRRTGRSLLASIARYRTRSSAGTLQAISSSGRRERLTTTGSETGRPGDMARGSSVKPCYPTATFSQSDATRCCQSCARRAHPPRAHLLPTPPQPIRLSKSLVRSL